MKLLGTPRTAHGMIGPLNVSPSGEQARLEQQIARLLPTPVAQFSGNTPENHLRKKPGRTVVTDLSIIVENGLLPSGGKLLPTPMATDGTHGGANQRGAKGDLRLSSAVHPHNFPASDLLPTPTSSLGSSGTIRRSGARSRPPTRSGTSPTSLSSERTSMNPDLRLTPEGAAFDEYVAYVEERHRIWELRSMGLPAPWTRSPILATKKFTNDFRVLDPGSQYVLRMVQDAEDPMDVVFRAFLYRFTNLPEPWETYRERYGRWPEIRDVGGTLDAFLLGYAAEGRSILNSAYVIAPPSSARWTGVPRIEWLLWMIRNAFLPGGEFEVDPYVADPESSPAERHAILTAIPRCGDFLGLQVVTDIGYSDLLPSDEDEFVVPGPGSTRGLAALGRSTRRSTAISEIRSIHSEIRSRVTLDVRGTPRPLSLMDVQNTLCEFSKYHRLAAVTGTSRKYAPSAARTSSVHTDPTYPNHWS